MKKSSEERGRFFEKIRQKTFDNFPPGTFNIPFKSHKSFWGAFFQKGAAFLYF